MINVATDTLLQWSKFKHWFVNMKSYKKTISLLASIFSVYYLVPITGCLFDYFNCQASECSYACSNDTIQEAIFGYAAIMVMTLFFIYKFLTMDSKDDTLFLFLTRRLSRKKEEPELKLKESKKWIWVGLKTLSYVRVEGNSDLRWKKC